MRNSDLIDQFAIQRVITEYAWFVDRRDWAALVATFADTVVVDYTAMNGGEPETLSGHEQVDRWQRELGALDSTQHVVTGVIADVRGDTATATANVLAWLRRDNVPGGRLWHNGGTYEFELHRWWAMAHQPAGSPTNLD
ncbi:nuclear transport factor 2 family protein [Micromonospora sp. DR5-3]|uniref:nuclear transport factor 2 family protein n=1 Tax=unclassified Micromonospora TaxID=2617518 RepID=UPI0011DB7E58|nr:MULTISPECIES: nuclear transport factor 2 family protein [unclassified Micromonospora]MCW3820807.1 nuclear transport factor 2 family protein [Micromonospora sp. DR5-3]TYC11446.1 nuclear transport factor 2 family protein [Micromonospora sp. MP36]